MKLIAELNSKNIKVFIFGLIWMIVYSGAVAIATIALLLAFSICRLLNFLKNKQPINLVGLLKTQ